MGSCRSFTGLQWEMQVSNGKSKEIPTCNFHHLNICASQIIFAKKDDCWCGCLAVWWELVLQAPNSNSCLWPVNKEERSELALVSLARQVCVWEGSSSLQVASDSVQSRETRDWGRSLEELLVCGCFVKERVASPPEKFLKVLRYSAQGNGWWLYWSHESSRKG